MARASESMTSFLFGLLVGSLAGGLLGFLFSPRSGEANRQLLAERFGRQLPDDLSNPYSDTRQFFDGQKARLEGRFESMRARRLARRQARAKELEALDLKNYRVV